MLTEIFKTWMEIFTLKGGAIGGIQKPTTTNFPSYKGNKMFLKITRLNSQLESSQVEHVYI